MGYGTNQATIALDGLKAGSDFIRVSNTEHALTMKLVLG